ncbi:MAG: polysaccharide biosynthesis C-terminal domain-containing protein [Terriglobia bacterium]
MNVHIRSALEATVATEAPKASWLRRRLGALKWSGKGLLAILDQGLISGSNYLMAILLARHLTAQQYGSYALAFELFLFMAVAYGALVLEPFSVFGPSVYLRSLTGYLGSLLRLHLASGAIVAAVVGTAAWIAYAVAPGTGLAPALLGAAIAGPCVLVFWLARRAFYVKFSPHLAVWGAVVYSAALLGGLVVVYRLGHLSPLTAFLLMAAGAVATTPAMLARLKPDVVSKSGGPDVSEVARKHWGYGRWALASSVMVYLSSAIFYPLLASFQGLADAGSMKALMNFSSPIGQVFAALSLLALPYSARVHHQDGSEGTRRLVWKLTILYGGGTFLYWVVIIALREPLVHYLYGGKYSALTALLPWVALGSVFRISATSFAVTLRAMKAPETVFIAYSVSSVAAVLFGAPLTWLLGLEGAVFAFVLSGAVSCIVALMLVHRRYPLVRSLEAA